MEESLVEKLSSRNACLYKKVEALEAAMLDAKEYDDIFECAKFYRDTVFAAMQELRAIADDLETIVGETYWPFPTYGELLFGV